MTASQAIPPSGSAGTAAAGRLLLLVGHSSGGIGGHVASLATGLPAHGWQVTVATAADTARRFALGDRVEVLWPGSRPAPQPAATGSAHRVVTTVRDLRRLRTLAGGADVLHAHGHQAGLLALAVAASLPRRRRPVVVVSWHNAVLGAGARRRLSGLGERLQARRVDLLTGASADLVERARTLGATAARLAPVPAPAGDAPQPRATREGVGAEIGVDPGARWALTVSRIAPQKDLATLVEAAAHPQAPADTLWLVVGEGDPGLADRLRARAEHRRAPVHLVGPRRDVPALMALSDVFVLPSTWEARALVVQEAMAAGTPVVCTAVGGLPELLAGAGLLVPPGDAASLARAVGAVLDDPALAARLADAGRARFASLPGEADVLADWVVTYAALLAGRSRRGTGSG